MQRAQTHEWNTVDAQLALNAAPSHLRHGAGRPLRIAISLANQDGVYALSELARGLPDADLPETLHNVLEHLVEGTGVYSLADLRRELREYAATDWDDESEDEEL